MTFNIVFAVATVFIVSLVAYTAWKKDWAGHFRRAPLRVIKWWRDKDGKFVLIVSIVAGTAGIVIVGLIIRIHDYLPNVTTFVGGIAGALLGLGGAAGVIFSAFGLLNSVLFDTAPVLIIQPSPKPDHRETVNRQKALGDARSADEAEVHVALGGAHPSSTKPREFED